MQRKLQWNAVGLGTKLQIFQDFLKNLVDQTPDAHSNKKEKYRNFLGDINNVIQKIEQIDKILIPKLENIMHLEFETPEMVYLALCRPSINNLFKHLNGAFLNNLNLNIKDDDFKELKNIGDVGNTLALIGDAALDLAIVETLWDASVSKIGTLTEKRKEIVKNKHLAKICDKWGLYNYKLIRFSNLQSQPVKETTINHEKATLVEAIFGIIYMEFGFDKVLRCVPMIQ